MKEYVASLLLLCAVISIGSLLAYRENDKILHFAFSVIFCAAVILPLSANIGGALSSGISDSEISLPDGEREYEACAEKALAEAFRTVLCDELGIPEDNMRLDGEGFDFERMRFSSVSISLYGSSVFSDISAIERFAKENFGGCDVKIKLG